MNNQTNESREFRQQLNDISNELLAMLVEQEKASFVLAELTVYFGWATEPTAQKAMAYGIGLDESEEAKRAFYYLSEYRRIEQFIDIAIDYCHSVHEAIDSLMKKID